jgi:hypothetical protein
MYCLLASLALSFVPVATDDAAAKELAALAQKVKDAESYSFTFLPAKQEEVKDAKPWQVEVKKKLPYHYQRGDVDFFKSDEKLVLKGKDGKWTLADMNERANHPTPKAGGATPQKKDGGGDGKTGEPAKNGEGGEHKVGLDRLVAATETIPLPHRLFNDFAAKLEEVTKESKDGAVVYHAKLTPAAAREIMNARAGHAAHAGGKGEARPPAGGAGGGAGGAGGAAGGDGAAPKHEIEASGTMNITAKGDAIESIDFDLDVKAKAGDHTAGGIITISKLNATNLELPPEVKTALGIGAAPEKK